MSNDELQALKALAEAATPGPWINHNGRVVSASDMDVGSAYEGDAAFIAAANPQTVLALVAEVDRLQQDAARLNWLQEHGSAMGSAIEMDHGVWVDGADLRAAIDAGMKE
jgi:hypothetical protein